jgi:hypothetical protein
MSKSTLTFLLMKLAFSMNLIIMMSLITIIVGFMAYFLKEQILINY